MKTWPLWSIIWLVVVSVSGCSEVPEPDIFSGTETCRPPCWLNIMPGKTTRNEMIQVLETRENEKAGEVVFLERGITRWESSDFRAYIYTDLSGIVSMIKVDLRSQVTYSLGETIAFFGEPTNIEIGKVRDGYFSFVIFYPGKGLAFVGNSNGNVINHERTNFPIHPEMTIITAFFFQPAEISTVWGLLYGDNTLPEIQNWAGYGLY